MIFTDYESNMAGVYTFHKISLLIPLLVFLDPLWILPHFSNITGLKISNNIKTEGYSFHPFLSVGYSKNAKHAN